MPGLQQGTWKKIDFSDLTEHKGRKKEKSLLLRPFFLPSLKS